ncbi:MAG: hypothetical protein C4335_02275 [Armatimonadota bacterium]
MIVWICTDMEGLAGIDSWNQCYHPDDHAPEYRYGREQLTAEVNAAVAGCFDAGATEVRVSDGHGRNRNQGFIREKLHPRARVVGAYSVPLAYVSGDEALCEEARRLFPHVLCTPTKRGTGWATCELYPPDEVRARIRCDIATAIRHASRANAWRVPTPIAVSVEWAYSAPADDMAKVPGVCRIDARTVAWKIDDPRDIYTFPSSHWHPPLRR